jgi:hypothetical protein
MGANYVATQSGMLVESKINRGTLTEICGVEQELISNLGKGSGMDVPMYDQEVQVKFDQAETTEIGLETSKIS